MGRSARVGAGGLSSGLTQPAYTPGGARLWIHLQTTEMVFANICELMAPVLSGPARAEIVAAAAKWPRMPDALAALATGISGHVFTTSRGVIRFAKVIQRYDGLTRAEGFHAMNDWDGISDRVNPDIIPIDVLNYIADLRRNDATDHRVLAILLDYYFMHVLSLMSLRIWDDGDPDQNLDLLGGLLASLQGPQGSGQRFADDAETLILIATSHYEREERGYAWLLEKVMTLNRPHRVRIALGHAGSMGCHLRFGYEATYGKDATLMREDNVTDYPWLRFALITLLHELTMGIEGEARDVIVEAIVGGLSADAAQFMNEPAFMVLFEPHRAELVAAMDRHRPTDSGYSPLAFFFNFSHNVIKGAVVDAMLWGEPWAVTLNDLLTSHPSTTPAAAPLSKRFALATTLMDYARKNPHRIRGRMTPVIVYDPATGRRVLAAAQRTIAPVAL